jgi:hypothetical protein
MNFLKFSKFLVAIFSFLFLYSGFSVVGMENNISSSWKDIKLPKCCEMCNKKVEFAITNLKNPFGFSCNSRECIEKFINKYWNNLGVTTVKIQAGNFSWCQEAKNLDCVDTVVLPCGHIICACQKCSLQKIKQMVATCPECKNNYNLSNVIFVKRNFDNVKGRMYIYNKLKNDWSGKIVISQLKGCKPINIYEATYVLSTYCWDFTRNSLNESKVAEVNSGLEDKNNIWFIKISPMFNKIIKSYEVGEYLGEDYDVIYPTI